MDRPFFAFALAAALSVSSIAGAATRLADRKLGVREDSFDHANGKRNGSRELERSVGAKGVRVEAGFSQLKGAKPTARDLTRSIEVPEGFEASVNAQGEVELTPPEKVVAHQAFVAPGTLTLVAFGRPVSIEIKEETDLNGLAKNLREAGFSLEEMRLGNGASWSPYDFKIPMTLTAGKQLDPKAVQGALERLASLKVKVTAGPGGEAEGLSFDVIERMAREFGLLPTRSSHVAPRSHQARDWEDDPQLAERLTSYLEQQLEKDTGVSTPAVPKMGGSPSAQIARAAAAFSTQPVKFDALGRYSVQSQLPVVILTGPSGTGGERLAKQYAEALHAHGRLATSAVLSVNPTDLITDKPWIDIKNNPLPAVRNATRTILEKARGKVLLVDVGASGWGPLPRSAVGSDPHRAWGVDGKQSLGGRLGGVGRVAWETIVEYGHQHPGEIAIAIKGYPDEVDHFSAYDQSENKPWEAHNDAAQLFQSAPRIGFGDLGTPGEQLKSIERQLEYQLFDGRGKTTVKEMHAHVHLAVQGGTDREVDALAKRYAGFLEDHVEVGKYKLEPPFVERVNVIHLGAKDLATAASAKQALDRTEGNIVIVDYASISNAAIPEVKAAMENVKEASVFILKVGGKAAELPAMLQSSPLLKQIQHITLAPASGAMPASSASADEGIGIR